MEATSVETHNAKLERLLSHLLPPPPYAAKQNQNMYRQNADTVFPFTHSRYTGHKLRWPKSGAISRLDLCIM